MNENQSRKHAFHKHASPGSQKLFVCTSVHAARFSPAALHPLCMILNNDFDSRFGPQSLRQEYMDVCTICSCAGDLMFCSKCPRGFHTSCLRSASLKDVVIHSGCHVVCVSFLSCGSRVSLFSGYRPRRY